jgi:hypothetical protein
MGDGWQSSLFDAGRILYRLSRSDGRQVPRKPDSYSWLWICQ